MRRNEPISKIMTKNPHTVHHGQKLSEARALMIEHGVHHVPVVSGKKIVGMLSSTDLLRVSYEYEQDIAHANAVLDHTRTIEDVMQPNVMTIEHKKPVRRAVEIFAENWFHAMPVVDGDKIVGIVTTTDIMKYMLDQY